MAGPEQDVRVWSIQKKPDRPRPYVVRWMVDRRSHSRSYRTKAQAERFRSRLLLAQQQGERFSDRTGEPVSWAPSPADQSVYEWARRWVAHEWDEWAPRTRRSELEALSRFIPLVVGEAAPPPPPDMRRYLEAALRPDDSLPGEAGASTSEAWLQRWVVTLGQLDEEMLAMADRQLGIGLEGQPLAATTSTRFRRTAKSCIQRAADLKLIEANPWPPTPRGRTRRKARRQNRAVDVQRLPDPVTMLRIIEAMANHQPASRVFQMMTSVGYYAGLRPSEVVMLRRRALTLPAEGWGRIDVFEADDGYGQSAEPKTGFRTVPIPPSLVALLASWIEHVQALDETALLFATRTGRRPSLANWNRALTLAAQKVGHRSISPYDCRHTCATTWLGAGVGLGEAALRLGHSVDTLVTYYVGALEGDDVRANDRIGKVLRAAELQLRDG